ncbi:PLP-dependent cysteine synthase family protein [Aggregatilinea lenta]|uniref:PLP-dependent cysteine synthase family protein n=1 Tax=Aggregatilinea lenta TaxID=913108 RepID=UPI001EE8D01F|nr:pyridoxal-phosphate dependent enzyme [Aggregatilinea lenta]
MSERRLITGPTFEEMLHPNLIDPEIRAKAHEAKTSDPLDSINLYNISWRDMNNQIQYVVLPPELTGVDTPIAVLTSVHFPSGSHKVGATYSVLIEKELFGDVDPWKHTLVWPSTGNYGIGGAYVAGRMGCNSLVILPEEMSQERFDKIEAYGAQVIKTPGCESNVKEIYDKTHELRASDPDIRIMNQFEEMGNYRFHYYVTGNTIVDLAKELAAQGIGSGKVSAFTSAMGSAGTIAAGDRIKQEWPDHKIVGLEPIQCPTLALNGYGGHDIQGIGDKHVTWIHHVQNTDAMMCIDDVETKLALQIFADEGGRQALVEDFGIDPALVDLFAHRFGISSLCNIFGAIKAVKHYGFGPNDLVVTIATDGMDRYPSVMDAMRQTYGVVDRTEAIARVRSLYHGLRTDWIFDGSADNRERWHNLKYYTWVEQQGKTVDELEAQRCDEWWEAEQARVSEIDAKLREYRQSQQG